ADVGNQGPAVPFDRKIPHPVIAVSLVEAVPIQPKIAGADRHAAVVEGAGFVGQEKLVQNPGSVGRFHGLQGLPSQFVETSPESGDLLTPASREGKLRSPRGAMDPFRLPEGSWTAGEPPGNQLR